MTDAFDGIEKYGCESIDIRFELDDWALIATPEGGEGLDCVHGCNREDKLGILIGWSYQIPNHPRCPGCDALMPDEVQGLYQMANMDGPARLPDGWIGQSIDRSIKRCWVEWEKKLFLTGDGKGEITKDTV